MPYLNIAHINKCTEAEGPGKRFAIWVQGCLKRCPGCCNPQMLEIEPAKIYECDDLVEMIRTAKEEEGIEGITLLGGEPFLQANGLAYVANKCKSFGVSTMVFSGYTIKELDKLNLAYTETFLNEIDILVDGPFIESLYDEERNWVGSSNQQFHYFSERYKKGLEYEDSTNKIELTIDHDNQTVQINGWPFSVK